MKEAPERVGGPKPFVIHSYNAIALAYCFAFSFVYASLPGQAYLTAVHAAAFVGVLGNYLLYLWHGRHGLHTNAILFWGTSVVVSLFAMGGWAEAGLLWTFAYLPYAFFLANDRGAVLWTGLLFLLEAGLAAASGIGWIHLPYSLPVLVNFFTALLVFGFCMFLFKIAVTRYETLYHVAAEEQAEARVEEVSRRKEIERLEELNQFKTDFLNNAAHELSTPLTPLKLQLYMFHGEAGKNLTPSQQNNIQLLERNVSRIERLVRDILDSARLQAAKLGLEKAPVDLAQVLEEAVETFRPQARLAGLEIESPHLPHLPVTADASRLAQVLDNLLSNAIKFTPRGGKIRVEARALPDSAMVSVTDTGLGLTADQIRRLFRPFSQVHDVRHSTTPGTGLGLYISRAIVELHGGSLWCTSLGPGHGSTFSFVLPWNADPAAVSTARASIATP